MNYKLLHMLFRWDYIAWQNSADNGLARVHVTPEGEVYYWRYKITKVRDVITKPSQVGWLTCSPNKYFKQPNNYKGGQE